MGHWFDYLNWTPETFRTSIFLLFEMTPFVFTSGDTVWGIHLKFRYPIKQIVMSEVKLPSHQRTLTLFLHFLQPPFPAIWAKVNKEIVKNTLTNKQQRILKQATYHQVSF